MKNITNIFSREVKANKADRKVYEYHAIRIVTNDKKLIITVIDRTKTDN